MRKLSTFGLALFWASLSFAQPPGPPISPGGSGGGSGTVTGPGAPCVDNQIARWDGATTTALQCSPLVVSDTTGDLTAPGALTISTAASDGNITLDPHGTGDAVVAGGASLVLSDGTVAVDSIITNCENTGLASVVNYGDVCFMRSDAPNYPAAIHAETGHFANYDYDGGTKTANIVIGSNSATGNTSAIVLGRSGENNAEFVFGYDDFMLFRRNASILGLRQRGAGTGVSTFELYMVAPGDFTGYGISTDYERLSLSGTAGSSVNITAETAGTGADDLSVNVSGSGVGTVNLTRARIVPSAAPPVTCAAGTEGTLYVDSDTHKLCYCNGSGWVLASDDSTGCS